MQSEFPPVLTKKDFVKRFQTGEFGNKTKNWDTLKDFIEDGCCFSSSFFHLRNRVAGGTTYYDQTPAEICLKWGMMHDPSSWYTAEMAPTEQTVFQGEVVELEKGLSLFYSTIPKPMRDSLKEGGKQVFGLTAKILLEHYLDPCDYEWIQVLLQRFPSHVVEFSTYAVRCGTLNQHTIIWECRLY